MSDNGLQRFSDVFLGRIPDYVTADKNFVYPKKKRNSGNTKKIEFPTKNRDNKMFYLQSKSF